MQSLKEPRGAVKKKGQFLSSESGRPRVSSEIVRCRLRWLQGVGLQISLGGFWSWKGIIFFSVSGVSETVLTELQTDGAREAMKGN